MLNHLSWKYSSGNTLCKCNGIVFGLTFNSWNTTTYLDCSTFSVKHFWTSLLGVTSVSILIQIFCKQTSIIITIGALKIKFTMWISPTTSPRPKLAYHNNYQCINEVDIWRKPDLPRWMQKPENMLLLVTMVRCFLDYWFTLNSRFFWFLFIHWGPPNPFKHPSLKIA